MEESRWIEGVTPTWTECPHGVVTSRGTYLRALEPTGEHPDCQAALAAHEERAAEEYYAEAVRVMYS